MLIDILCTTDMHVNLRVRVSLALWRERGGGREQGRGAEERRGEERRGEERSGAD